MDLRGRTHPDKDIAALAEGQGGVVGQDQLLREGLTYGQIRARVRSGHLHPWHREVYVVGHPSLTPEGLRWAAVISCGSGAVLSHSSNAVHRVLLSGGGPRIDVVVPTGREIRRPGVRVRRAVLVPHEVELVRGLRCTSIPRLLLELSATRPAVLERVWREAVYGGVLDMDAVAELLRRRRGERGTVRLRGLYDRRHEIIGRLNGQTEDLVLPIIRESVLGEPRSNAWIWVGHRHIQVDFYFPRLKLVIEGDSRLAHADPEAEVEDALRDEELRAVGIQVHRVIYDDARWRPHRVLIDLNALITR